MSLSDLPSSAARANRLPTSLNHKLDHKLLGYAAAASAAGVGMLALAQPSQAEIVYTPTHQTLKPNGNISLDLNNDGVTDLILYDEFDVCGGPAGPPECSGYTRQSLLVRPTAGNGVLVGSRWAPPLPAGKNIGPGKMFSAFGTMERCSTSVGRGPYSSGPWRDVKSRYLGLSISVSGQTYYGWARLSVHLDPKLCTASAVLTGYAYETVPGKPIAAGQTSGPDEVSKSERPQSTLGALALGSTGLVAWRREEDEN